MLYVQSRHRRVTLQRAGYLGENSDLAWPVQSGKLPVHVLRTDFQMEPDALIKMGLLPDGTFWKQKSIVVKWYCLKLLFTFVWKSSVFQWISIFRFEPWPGGGTIFVCGGNINRRSTVLWCLTSTFSVGSEETKPKTYKCGFLREGRRRNKESAWWKIASNNGRDFS